MEVVGFYFDRLTALRGLKVKFVAERAGVKPGYVSRLISRDIKEPSAAVLKALTAPGQSLRNNTKKTTRDQCGSPPGPPASRS